MYLVRNRVIFVSAILLLALAFRIYGLNYGLPSQQRIGYYFSERKVEKVPEEDLKVYAMLGTAHIDENDILGAISNMNPSKLDFNPHYFYWGSLHFYFIALLLKIASLFKAVMLSTAKRFYFLHPEEIAKIYLWGRAASVMFSVFTVFMIYRIGRKLYNEKTGILSALLLSVFFTHVNLSHYMLPNIPTLFWAMVALYFCINLLETGRLKWYILAGVAAGLSMGTKYNGIILVFPIIAAHFIYCSRNKINVKNFLIYAFDKKLTLSLVIMACVFFLTNPYLILSFKEAMPYIFGGTSGGVRYLPYSFKAFIFNIIKNSFIRTAVQLHYGMGFPLVVLFLIGTVFSVYKREKGDLLLLSFTVPFYLCISGMRHCYIPYLLFLMPVGILFGSRFFINIIESAAANKQLKALIYLIIILITIATAFNT